MIYKIFLSPIFSLYFEAVLYLLVNKVGFGTYSQ